MKAMKALLLAAGLGSRLRPLTHALPKCLVPVKGIPVLGHWLHLLEKHGFEEVLINTGYQSEKVLDFLDTFYTPLRIHTTHEDRLLGTGGTIRANREFLAGGSFLVAHVDNLTNANLGELMAFAAPRLTAELPVAIGLFRCPRPRECGIVEIRDDGVITSFHEKVEDPPGDLANAGLYACHESVPSLLDRVAQETGGDELDLCRDALTRLEGRLLGWPIGDAFLIDIGNVEAYERANLDPDLRIEFPPGRTDVGALLSPMHAL